MVLPLHDKNTVDAGDGIGLVCGGKERRSNLGDGPRSLAFEGAG
jgi:hypothetical protein